MDPLEKSITRKAFFKEVLGWIRQGVAEAQAEGLSPRAESVLLPPGARDCRSFLSACSRCHACVTACPHFALRVCQDEASPLFGYPMIDPRQQACYLCHDFPCIQACASGALGHWKTRFKLGTAEFDASTCLDEQQGFCQTCLNHCPHMGRAVYRDVRGRLTIAPEHCTGCGICVMVCVQDPPAIAIRAPAVPQPVPEDRQTDPSFPKPEKREA